MRDILNQLSTGLVNRPTELRKQKGRSVKVVGFFPGEFVPEELIHAAGAIPICLIHGGNPNVVDASLSVTSRFLCPFARAQMGEQVLKEQPYYTMVDFLVSPISCQHLRRAGDVWEYYSGIEVFRLGVPYKNESERGLEYYVKMFDRLRKRLEEVTGNAITDDRLRHSISVYNRLRDELRQIGDLRRRSGSVSTLDFIRLNHASFYLDPVMITGWLEQARKRLSNTGDVSRGGAHPRLLLTGPCIAYGDYKVLELIEECGGDIVVEEVAEGLRSYRSNVSLEGDPLRALAVKYLRDRIPPAFMRLSARKRFDHLMKLAKEYDVAGVVWYQLLYCDTYDIESYFFEKQLDGTGLRMLKLESDYNVQDRGPLRTRIEAFVETIKIGGRK
jgi:benzoyl-CoA reductase/2-hydroxyglutaryl-CoA dehydratase subunit BcrC/BadD/HgdB